MVRQRHRGDCGLAALATLLVSSHTYEDVQAAAAVVDPDHHGEHGLKVQALPQVARLLGLELTRHRRLALDTDCGVVVVHGPHVARSGHYVAVSRGWVLDPLDGQARPWRAYQAHYGARFTTGLLVRPGRRLGPTAAPHRLAAARLGVAA